MKIDLAKPNYKKGQNILLPDGNIGLIVKVPPSLRLRRFIRFVSFGKIDKTKTHTYHVWSS